MDYVAAPPANLATNHQTIDISVWKERNIDSQNQGSKIAVLLLKQLKFCKRAIFLILKYLRTVAEIAQIWDSATGIFQNP